MAKPNPGAPSPRASSLLPALAVGLIVLIAYANSFTGSLVFDDHQSIALNPSIRAWSTALHPPGGGVTVSGRPVLNLSFALNYALGGLDVRGYHAINLAIHLLAALTVFGIVRRALRLPRMTDRFSGSANALAAAIAALWAVHPLQTESVTYLVQRAESLMGLFYLLTLYGFIRTVEARREDAAKSSRAAWIGLSLAACWLGMATKEVMVSAPVMVLLFDRAFVAVSWREIFARRRGYYLGLFASWALLALLVLGNAGRGGTSGFGAGAGWWDYLGSQCHAFTLYLRLALWPDPLIFDYGTLWLHHGELGWAHAAGVAMAVGLVLLALRRGHPLGYLGLWYFAILAPTSLVPGNRQTVSEHRLYLALLPLVVLAVLALHRRFARRGLWACIVAVLVFTALTLRRNEAYRTEIELCADTVAKLPENYFARANLGGLLVERGDLAGALPHLERAVADGPDCALAHNNYGNALLQFGRVAEAVPHLERAVALDPRDSSARYNLANSLVLRGQPAEALRLYDAALALQPAHPAALLNSGIALLQLQRPAEAAPRLERAAALTPRSIDAHYNYGVALSQLGRRDAALVQFQSALALDANHRLSREAWERLRP